eukprot:5413904-Pyramimonas_sp.AAC.1
MAAWSLYAVGFCKSKDEHHKHQHKRRLDRFRFEETRFCGFLYEPVAPGTVMDGYSFRHMGHGIVNLLFVLRYGGRHPPHPTCLGRCSTCTRRWQRVTRTTAGVRPCRNRNRGHDVDPSRV